MRGHLPPVPSLSWGRDQPHRLPGACGMRAADLHVSAVTLRAHVPTSPINHCCHVRGGESAPWSSSSVHSAAGPLCPSGGRAPGLPGHLFSEGESASTCCPSTGHWASAVSRSGHQTGAGWWQPRAPEVPARAGGGGTPGAASSVLMPPGLLLVRWERPLPDSLGRPPMVGLVSRREGQEHDHPCPGKHLPPHGFLIKMFSSCFCFEAQG